MHTFNSPIDPHRIGDAIAQHNMTLIRRLRGGKPLIEHGLLDNVVSAVTKVSDEVAGAVGKTADELGGVFKVSDELGSFVKVGDELGSVGKIGDELGSIGKVGDELGSIGKVGDEGGSLLKTSDELSSANRVTQELDDLASSTTKSDPTSVAEAANSWKYKLIALGVAGTAVATTFVAQAIKRYQDTNNKTCNITSISKDDKTGKTKVIFSPTVPLDTNCTVDITASNSVPSVDGASQAILSVFSASTIILDHVIKTEGNSGTLVTHSTFEGSLSQVIKEDAKLAAKTVSGVASAVAEGTQEGLAGMFKNFFGDWWKIACSACCVSIILAVVGVIMLKFM